MRIWVSWIFTSTLIDDGFPCFRSRIFAFCASQLTPETSRAETSTEARLRRPSRRHERLSGQPGTHAGSAHDAANGTLWLRS
jgi:hypothetical protein